MYKPKTEKDIRCPLEYGMEVFGGKWKPRIICMLGLNGRMRYGELKKELSPITDTVLAAMLKELVNDDIVCRTQYEEIPPRVEYSLSEVGESLKPVMGSICIWSRIRQGESDEAALCTKCYYKRK